MRHLTALILVLAASLPAVAAAQQVKPICISRTRDCLVAIVKTNFDALMSRNGAKMPLAADVRRTENGLDNARGEREVRDSYLQATMVKRVRDLRFTVDEQRGEVVVYYLGDIELRNVTDGAIKAGDNSYKVALTVPPGDYTVHKAARFLIKKGLITEIEMLGYVQKAQGGKSGW